MPDSAYSRCCLREILLPLADLLVLEGEVLPPVVLVNNSTFPGSRMSSQEKQCRFENSDLFPPEYVLPNLVKISCWGKPEGLDSFLQCECFHTKRVSQMLDRWQYPLRKNERKLFNMSDYRLFRNFMWTFAISSCYQIVIYLVHLFSNDRRMRHSQFHHPYNSEQGEPDRLYLCCHKLFRRRDFLLH